jgi:eukaryotic-like serine/threonine-protein kinase
MNESHNPDRIADKSSVPADASLAAASGAPCPSLGACTVRLKEAEGDSADTVKPQTDAMPSAEETNERYQLFGEIARGGMGAVLRGRDIILGRDLAVKVLLGKHAHQSEVVRRFHEEAQIGGQLQHPNMVPVYDIGRFGERPFFTMKLVKGQTLAALLGERTDPATDRPRLLAIALQVAQALAYAHARGVIHRDLKPANIMVGSFGEVQVMDWGLAKVLAEGGVAETERANRQLPPDEDTQIRTARSDSSGLGSETEAGTLLGTLAYMPPEQARGDHLDRRVDVFGLGAILCEILTGQPPYVARSVEEVRCKAVNGDLTDALTRLDGCGADAELIVLTKACLSPEAIHRPRDAQAVVDGLRGYLEGVQERLHQAELAEAEARAKAIEEAKRRRLTVALAATVLLALTLGGGGWLWVKGLQEAHREQLHQKERAEAEAKATEAEAKARAVAQLTHDVHDALNKATALREKAQTANVGGAALFGQAREQAQRALALVENGPADDLLKEQVRQLQAELDQEDKDRKLVVALEEARLAQADTSDDRHGYASERAVPRFREAFRAYGLPAGEGEPAAAAERIRQRPAAVREAIVAALDEWDDLAGQAKFQPQLAEPHRPWLRAVLEAAERDDGWMHQFRVARQEKDPARKRAALEKLAAAEGVEKQPPRALTRLAARLSPAQAADLLRRAQQQHSADFWVNHDLGVALLSMTPPQRDEAVRFLTAAVALRPESPGARLVLGSVLQATGHLDAALACYHTAIDLDPKYAAAHNDLGVALQVMGQLDEAIGCFHTAIDLDPTDATSHNNLGNALQARGQRDAAMGNALQARRQLDAAIACFRTAIDLDSKFAGAHNSLGNALKAGGQVDAAIASYKKAIDVDPKYANAHYNLGLVLQGRGELEEALASYKKAIDLNPRNARAWYQRGLALQTRGHLDAAMASYRTAIDIDRKYALAHNNLGVVLQARGQLDAAITSYRTAIDLNPKYAIAHNNLGNALKDKGQLDAAIASYRTAIDRDPKFAAAHCNLGFALRSQGHLAESLAALQRGHELGTKQPDWAHPSGDWVRQAERMAALEDKWPAFLKGEFQPRDVAERLDLAGVCQAKKYHVAVARLFADAFAADPSLAANVQAGHRYNAACSAALAAAGRGEDAGELDDLERVRLRKQAFDWLRADLTAYTTLSESGPAARSFVQKQLKHWRQNSALASLRDEAALANLPAKQRAAFTQLWADVAALLKKTETPGEKEGK